MAVVRGGIMEYKCLLVSIAFLFAFLLGCDDRGIQPNKVGCIAAYNDLYPCQTRKPYDQLMKTETPMECGEFADRLGDGAYWIERIDESGEMHATFELVGETGWMSDGTTNDGISRCVLEDVSADSITFSCYAIIWTSLSGKCELAVCSIRLPLRPDAQEIELPHRNSPCGIGFDQDAVNAAIKADSSAYSIVLNDSIVEIKILDAQITWTKRPGL